MVGNSIRGGICYGICENVNANNEYTKDYDDKRIDIGFGT